MHGPSIPLSMVLRLNLLIHRVRSNYLIGFAPSMKQPYLTLESTKQAHFHSFDVFDTALTRIWAKPTDLFWELGIQLQTAQLIQMTPETWQRLRDDVENILRRASPTGEVKLSQIYRQLGSTCGWSSAEAEKAMQHEIQLEIASLRVVPATQRKIQALHCQNQPIAFLSDMHLSSETIQSFLKEHQLWAEGDGLYVSNEVGLQQRVWKTISILSDSTPTQSL